MDTIAIFLRLTFINDNMIKEKVDFHPSVVIVTNSEQEDLFCSKYDDSYPIWLYRNTYNLIGGNPRKDMDRSPKDVFLREIREEFDPSNKYLTGDPMKWALPEDIEAIRNGILTAEAVGDFYIWMPDLKSIGGRPEHTVILSTYQADVPTETLGLVRKNLEDRKRIITEGYAGITTKNNLVDGKNKLAHSISSLLSKIWETEIIHPGGEGITRQIMTERIGPIRSDFRDYAREFEYSAGAFKI